MKGYILSFRRNAKIFPSAKSELEKTYKKYVNERENNNSYAQTCFGEFDQMEVKNIDDYSEYLATPVNDINWLGQKQYIFLYEPDHNCEISYNRVWQIKNAGDYKEITSTFIGITMYMLDNELSYSINQYGDFLKKIKEEINKKAKNLIEKNEQLNDVYFEVYGSLNPSEIVIIWFANEYTNILELANCVSDLKYKFKDNLYRVFFNSTTILSLNNKQGESSDYDGDVTLHLTISDTQENIKNIKDRVIKSIENNFKDNDETNLKENAYELSDKFNIVIKGKARWILPLFCDYSDSSLLFEKRIFGYDNIYSSIIDTYIELMYESKINVNENNIIDLLDGVDKEKLSKIKEGEIHLNVNICDELYGDRTNKYGEKTISKLYGDIRDIFREKFPKSSGSVDVLDRLYSDFNSNIQLTYNSIWQNDFKCQFYATLSTLYGALDLVFKNDDDESKMLDPSDFWKKFTELLDNIRQQVYHLSQSNRSFTHVPTSLLRYTGHIDLLLHSRYGLFKKILQTIYPAITKEEQTQLVPLITLGHRPQVRSIIYTTFKEHRHADYRLINIMIPGPIMLDTYKAFCYLVHEVFHFISPDSRNKRNILVGKLYFSEVLSRQILCDFEPYLNSLLHNKYSGEDKIFIDLYCDNVIKLLKMILRYVFIELLSQKNNIIIKTFANLHFNCKSKIYSNYIADFCVEIQKIDTNTYLEILKIIVENSQKYSDQFKEKIEQIYIPIMPDLVDERKIKTLISDTSEIFFKSFVDKIEAFLKDDFMYGHLAIKNFNVDDIDTEFLEPIREAIADIAMVDYLNMSFNDYLMFYVEVQEDCLIEPEKIPEEDFLRLYIIIKYISNSYLGGPLGDIFGDQKTSFKNLYIAHHILNNNNFSKLDRYCQEWYEKCNGIYVCCSEMYGGYDKIFYELTNLHTVKLRDKDLKLFKDLQSKIVDPYREIYQEISDNIDYVEKKVDVSIIDDKKGKLFEYNIEAVQWLQNQISLEELRDQLKSVVPEEDKNIYADLTVQYKNNTIIRGKINEHMVSSLNDLIETIFTAKEKVGMKENESPWFRGQCDANYNLLPSLFRKYGTTKLDISPAVLQRYYITEFETQCGHAIELNKFVNPNTADYIAAMQHYGVPTSFLDWSENALVSLYFALEPTLDKKSLYRQPSKAALYVFNPYRYNKIVKILEKEIPNTNPKRIHMYDFIRDDKILPNLSMNMYNDFLNDCTTADNLDYAKEIKHSANGDIDGTICFPLAITVSRTTERILKQKGTFVAFNLLTPQLKKDKKRFVKNFKEPYAHVCLKNLQNEILNNNTVEEHIPNAEDRIFLFKIELDMDNKDFRQEICNFLNSTGIHKDSFYPELQNIAERIAGII